MNYYVYLDMELVVYLCLTIIALIIGFSFILTLLHKKYKLETTNLKAELANALDQIDALENFQDEILDLEEKIFDEWLASQIKKRG